MEKTFKEIVDEIKPLIDGFQSVANNLRYINEMTYKIKMVSGKPYDELIDSMNQSILSLEDIYDYYCRFGKFPDSDTSKGIAKFKLITGNSVFNYL